MRRKLLTPHRLEAKSGAGRYSLWKGRLYFSSSDDSDPRVNGRRYEVRARLRRGVVGFGTGDLLAALKASFGVGVDLSKNMSAITRRKISIVYRKCVDCRNIRSSA